MRSRVTSVPGLPVRKDGRVVHFYAGRQICRQSNFALIAPALPSLNGNNHAAARSVERATRWAVVVRLKLSLTSQSGVCGVDGEAIDVRAARHAPAHRRRRR